MAPASRERRPLLDSDCQLSLGLGRPRHSVARLHVSSLSWTEGGRRARLGRCRQGRRNSRCPRWSLAGPHRGPERLPGPWARLGRTSSGAEGKGHAAKCPQNRGLASFGAASSSHAHTWRPPGSTETPPPVAPHARRPGCAPCATARLWSVHGTAGPWATGHASRPFPGGAPDFPGPLSSVPDFNPLSLLPRKGRRVQGSRDRRTRSS